MSNSTLRNLVIVAFVIALIPLVVLPFYNKQKDLRSDISQYEELLSAVETEGVEENRDLYGEYMTSVLGTYDQRDPRDESIQNILEGVEDIVEKFDDSKLVKIPSEVRLPTLDLSESVQFDLGNGESITVQEDGIDAALLFNGKKISSVLTDERVSLHIYIDSKLTYPTVIVGVNTLSKNTEEKVIYFLVDSMLVKYGTVNSLVDLEIYRDGDEEKLVTYSKDENIEGDLVTVWNINHIKKSIDSEYTVLDI